MLRAAIDEEKRRPRPASYAGEYAYHLGKTHARERNDGEAAMWFRESLDLGCSTVRMLLDMGEFLSKMNDSHDAAVKAYRRAIDLSPENPQTYNQLGLLYESAAQPDSAVAVWSRGMGRSRGASALAFNLALAYARRGDYSNAKVVLDRAIETAPLDSTLRSLRDEIEEEIRGEHPGFKDE